MSDIPARRNWTDGELAILADAVRILGKNAMPAKIKRQFLPDRSRKSISSKLRQFKEEGILVDNADGESVVQSLGSKTGPVQHSPEHFAHSVIPPSMVHRPVIAPMSLYSLNEQILMGYNPYQSLKSGSKSPGDEDSTSSCSATERSTESKRRKSASSLPSDESSESTSDSPPRPNTTEMDVQLLLSLSSENPVSTPMPSLGKLPVPSALQPIRSSQGPYSMLHPTGNVEPPTKKCKVSENQFAAVYGQHMAPIHYASPYPLQAMPMVIPFQVSSPLCPMSPSFAFGKARTPISEQTYSSHILPKLYSLN